MHLNIAPTVIFNFTFTFTFTTALALMLILTLATPSTALSETCPSTQSPYAPGCSSCTECCIFQFGTGSCAQRLRWERIVRDPACNPLSSTTSTTGTATTDADILLDHAWISECTGAFTLCELFNSTDCSGDEMVQIDNTADLCHAPGFGIGSFLCVF